MNTPDEVNWFRVWIIIAAFNEGPAIGQVISEIVEYCENIVVIDDGSSDDTAAAAQAAGATIVKHAVNLGQGAALQTGIHFALRRDADFIVTFDADGQHSACDIPALISALIANHADIACGSRFLGRAVNMGRARRVVLKLATVFTFFTTGLKMTDAHNGLRAMTRVCAQTVHIRQNRMAHASELISEIAQHKLKLVEVAVTVRYTDYSMKKGQKIWNALNILLDLIARTLYK